MRVHLWTDGSGVATGGPGGYGFVLQAIDANGEVLREREGSGAISEATNQRAEMTAVIEGLLVLNRSSRVTVFSDSEYVVFGFTRGRVEYWLKSGWRTREKKPVANRDLWEALVDATRLHQVEWRHVLGHAFVQACKQKCGWEDPQPRKRGLVGRCPECAALVLREQAFPLNHRADALASAARRTLLAQTP